MGFHDMRVSSQDIKLLPTTLCYMLESIPVGCNRVEQSPPLSQFTPTPHNPSPHSGTRLGIPTPAEIPTRVVETLRGPRIGPHGLLTNEFYFCWFATYR